MRFTKCVIAVLWQRNYQSSKESLTPQ